MPGMGNTGGVGVARVLLFELSGVNVEFEMADNWLIVSDLSGENWSDSLVDSLGVSSLIESFCEIRSSISSFELIDADNSSNDFCDDMVVDDAVADWSDLFISFSSAFTFHSVVCNRSSSNLVRSSVSFDDNVQSVSTVVLSGDIRF